MVMLALPLVLLNMIRSLKWLAPFSMIANLLMATGVGITFYYVFIDLPSIDERPHFTSLHQLPLFFGTAIFALEGIGVVRKQTNRQYEAQYAQYANLFRLFFSAECRITT
jgi:proton-coupled amino acid transporter